MANVEELRKDAEEMRKFISTSERPRVKEVLQRALLSVEQEISLLVHDQASHEEEKPTEEKPPTAQAKQHKSSLYTKAITSYGWDQSDKFVKIYLTLPGVEKIPAEKITSKFNKNSVDVVVHELDGKNHQLKIMKLCHNIEEKESYVKIRSGSLVIVMKKQKVKETWADVVSKAKESSPIKPSTDESEKDPQAAIMDLMKKMYDEGDDDMKRTINKAWTESMGKAASGGGLDMGGV